MYYELELASAAVPLSLVSFGSSVFLAAAICHAGIAARPDWLPLQDCTGFSVVGVDDAAALLLVCPPICSLDAGVDAD